MNTMTPSNSRGMALLLVLVAIALASVIGFAMLSSSAIQAQVTVNATQQASSEYLAESAVQAALYYLQYPHLMPPGWGTTAGYYIYATTVQVPSAAGSFDLAVTATSTRDHYSIHAIGRATPGGPAHEITVVAKVERAHITSAACFGGNIALPPGMSIDGTVQVNGSLNNLTGTQLTVISAPLPLGAYRVPTLDNLNFYGADQPDRRYVMPDGTVGYAQQLLSAPLSSPIADPTNPGKVFFYSNPTSPDLLLTSAVNINGTLVVKGGSLSVRANGIRITPESGMPALVVERDLNLYRTNNTLQATGVAWIGRRISWTALFGSNNGSALSIDGALLMPAGATIDAPGFGGSIVLKYHATKVDVPLLSTSLQPGKSVTVLAWNE